MNFDGSTFNPALDEDRLSSQLLRVKHLMQDGQWRTLGEISSLTGGSEASISARLRDLRKDRFGGYIIKRERFGDPGRGLFRYRLEDPIHFEFNEQGQGLLLAG